MSTVSPPTPGTANITVDRINRVADGKLTVEFSDGKRSWSVEVTAAQLQSFPSFQRALATKLGIWARHHSQDHHRARDRADVWQDEISYAFAAGAQAGGRR